MENGYALTVKLCKAKSREAAAKNIIVKLTIFVVFKLKLLDVKNGQAVLLSSSRRRIMICIDCVFPTRRLTWPYATRPDCNEFRNCNTSIVRIVKRKIVHGIVIESEFTDEQVALLMRTANRRLSSEVSPWVYFTLTIMWRLTNGIDPIRPNRRRRIPVNQSVSITCHWTLVSIQPRQIRLGQYKASSVSRHPAVRPDHRLKAVCNPIEWVRFAGRRLNPIWPNSKRNYPICSICRRYAVPAEE